MPASTISFRFSVLFAIATACLTVHASTVKVGEIPGSNFRVIKGDVSLPTGGIWKAERITDNHIRELYLLPSPEAARQQIGKRMGKVLQQRWIDQGRWKTQQIYWAYQQYALANAGIGPAEISNLDAKQYGYLIRNLNASSPWNSNDFYGPHRGINIDGPFVYIVPNAKFKFDQKTKRVRTQDREILAVELRPYVNDGKHWVLYTDGRCVREEIGPIVKERNLSVRPIIEKKNTKLSKEPTVSYTLVAVTNGVPKPNLQMMLTNSIDNRRHKLVWNWDKTEKLTDARLTIQHARMTEWQPYVKSGPAPVLRMWQNLSRASNNNRGNQTNMLSIMGGRAAIEETLQQQNLVAEETNEQPSINLTSVEGVTVKSHPFEQMLAGQAGGKLKLANAVAHDRFFVYVAKPSALIPFLDRGAEFISAAGSNLSGNRIDYGLGERYMDRLGVSRQTLENLLKSGLIQDIAISTPDLFFIDGTDITVIMRLNQPKLLTVLLRIMGIKLEGTNISTVTTQSGEPTYWAFRNGQLVVSTHRAEIQQSIDLMENDGAGSLGKSAEFRYMLTQVPVNENTRLYTYFSDPFVRRLVGPEVKIGQLRRLRSRVAMELLASKRLLAELDGVQDQSIDSLIRHEYLPASMRSQGITIDADGLVRSEVYGRASRQRTLLNVPMDRVTPNEKKAYDRYRDNYSRYWRRFFDPIAIRLDDDGPDSFELTTFILPLVDNSIYNQLRTLLNRHESKVPLPIPKVTPTPLLQFSLNMQDAAWQMIARDFADFFTKYSGASPAMLDDLGPSAHLAIFDSDPIISFGSGDFSDILGGQLIGSQGRQEMILLPVTLAVLTRPCSIWIETKDAGRTAQFLRQAAEGRALGDNTNRDFFSTSFHQVEGKDSWIYTINLFNFVKTRYGIELHDRFLVIRNLPWSNKDRIADVTNAELNSAKLTLSPAIAKLQLPGLFVSAADLERRATISGLGRLFPFMQLNPQQDIEQAIEQHQRLFGFYPVHPAGGDWQWDGSKLSSSLYGSPTKQRQPAFDPERQFGLLHAIESLSLNMQFEDDGLRSHIKWKLKSQP